MKKRTIIKLKSLFGGKSKLKRQLHQPPPQPYTKGGSRTPSPAPSLPPDSYRALSPSPPPPPAAPPRHPPSPPVPTSPVAPTAPEPPPGPRYLLPCATCSRTFLPESLAKHTKICEKTAAKKRKTFDSSRQRREGTDLAQFLPKNFGLPETSPFLEKSSPATVKPQPKKTQSVRSSMCKPSSELPKCPHCGRGFGARAFERHVEWCADKAKILPTAPTQPPPHVAQARHRLQARTQYKAPRAGRGSLTRDKSSNSRSASVESRGERAQSPPPPPRDSGDYHHHHHARTRASESMSSTECHEESPHVPVIRQNKRGSVGGGGGGCGGGGGGGGGGGTAGDAARARQARLARDLNSNRKTLQDDKTVRESKTDPCVSNKMDNTKCRNTIPAKKQKQSNKLENIATCINTIYDKDTGDNKEPFVKNNVKILNRKSKKRQSQIPKRSLFENNSEKNGTAVRENYFKNTDNNGSEKVPVLPSLKLANNILRTPRNKYTKEIKTKFNSESINANMSSRFKSNMSVLKKPLHITKESTISLDSLEANSSVNINSIGINTEKLSCPCMPCVIYENTDHKKFAARSNTKSSPQKLQKVATKNIKMNENPNEVKILYENASIVSLSAGQHKDNFSLSVEYHDDNLSYESKEPERVSALELVDSIDDFQQDYLAENYINILATDQISSETYTKQDALIPTCFDEFMVLTDKLILENDSNENLGSNSEELVFDLHTPNTESIENFDSQIDLGKNVIGSNNNAYRDTLSELKSQLKEILVTSSYQNDHKYDANRNLCAMEHITIYELQTIKADDSPKLECQRPQDTLPSINENNNFNKKNPFNKKKWQKFRKSNTNFKMLRDLKKSSKEFQTYIVSNRACETSSDIQSVSSETPPFKLPRIDNTRIDDDYDPFLSAARQMKELMSSDTNIPKKIQSTPKDPLKTLPYLRNHKEKSPPFHLRPDNTKTIKDAMNKNTQRTPILQRMKSFGSSNSDYSSVNTFGGRSSSFRVNRNDKKASPKLNTTFTKSSKENVSTLDKSQFNRTSSLNKSFSNYTSNYSLSKSKEKPVSMTSSLHHSFQRTVKPPNRLEKIEKLPLKKDFVNLDSILADDNSSTTDSNYIDPRLINENDNLPINVNTILNNPDIISSMESLLNTDNLPLKFESFKVQDNKYESNKNKKEHVQSTVDKTKDKESNIVSTGISLTPNVDDLSAQYDKIMTSLEQSIASKASVRDDDSLCEDFDLEEFMTSFDEELDKQKSNKRSYSSTTRVVKTSDRFNSNETSQLNSISSSPKVTSNRNGLIPFNKSTSMTFSNNNITETVFPSSVKRSASLLDSFQKKNTPQKSDSQYQKNRSRKYKAEEVRLEQDIMLSLEEFEKFYENEKMENWMDTKESHSYSRRTSNETDTVKRDSKTKSEKKLKGQDEQLTRGTNNNATPNGKISNDSAYSSLNRISPSKLSVCNPKEVSNMSASLERAGSDSGASHRDNELQTLSSDEFLALERSTETLDMHTGRQHSKVDKSDVGQRGGSHASSGHRTPSSRSWRSERRAELSASSTESLRAPPPRASPVPAPTASAAAAARLSRFCHECGSRFPDAAKFCIECGVKRLAL